jgi:DNA-binding response OmpR family regulator
VLARRQAERLHPHVPIALVTTESTEEDEARGRAAGAWDYLRKPFQSSDIQMLVRRAREQKWRWGAA